MPMKKEALSQFHQNRILTAARELFAEKGEAGASMDDIAARADYSKSTIYVYFANKEDILGHLVLEDMRAIHDGIDRCLFENVSFEARYFAICALLTALSKNDPAFLQRVLSSISVDEADFLRLPVLKEIYETGEQTNRLIERLFTDAVRQGEARETLEPVRAGLVFWSSICSLISFSANKEAYLKKDFGLTQDAFLRYGFELLLGAARRGGRYDLGNPDCDRVCADGGGVSDETASGAVARAARYARDPPAAGICARCAERGAPAPVAQALLPASARALPAGVCHGRLCGIGQPYTGAVSKKRKARQAAPPALRAGHGGVACGAYPRRHRQLLGISAGNGGNLDCGYLRKGLAGRNIRRVLRRRIHQGARERTGSRR